MENNKVILETLFKKGGIDVRRGDLFDRAPIALSKDFDFGRIEGMMLGLAIGDSLGRTTEGMLPKSRKESYGEIRDYLPKSYTGGKPIGVPSDDTQLAFWTLEQLINDHDFIPENVAERFSHGRIFGIGSAVKRFLANVKSGIPWFEAGTKSAGNGAIMRIAPIIIPHLRAPSADLWVDAALSAMMTHNDSASISSCVSFVNMLWELLKMETPPEPFWWLKTYVDVAKSLSLNEKCRPRGGEFIDYEGPIWKFVEEKVGYAYLNNFDTMRVLNSWYSGAYLLETVPSVIFLLMRYGHEPEEAIIRAVNDTKDNDTIAALVGAAVGALHGKKNLPKRWIENLSGRTRGSDDGKVFLLLEKARDLWGEKKPCCKRIGFKSVSDKTYRSGRIVLDILSVKTGRITGNCTLFIEKGAVRLLLADGSQIVKPIDPFDFYDALDKTQSELSTLNLGLKICGNCRFFGFSSMAHQFSDGENGYCTIINGLNVGASKGDVVGVLDACDSFSFRKEPTECSPWLPA